MLRTLRIRDAVQAVWARGCAVPTGGTTEWPRGGRHGSS